MKCNNCQSEMEAYQRGEATHQDWCSECGTVCFHWNGERQEWFLPKSVENTKKIVSELIKCRDRQSYLNCRLNTIDRDDFDRVDLSDER